ncbi:hydrophobin-like protein [Colletotrichum zoysiae]|uniref:Hydrophobin-like protein n=1 Tax=Colletotrichum zoysiae TaxID=1216348 RepID=A0AAD9HQ99_9PEZI|nr:hydrophobin-like protein [Colletotrichum zoysiae]
MQFSVALVALFASVTIAAPTGGEDGGSPAPYFPCAQTLYSQELCCAADVGGILGVDCVTPSSDPKSAEDFKKICAKEGQQPRCCTLPLLGLAVLCQAPSGI